MGHLRLLPPLLALVLALGACGSYEFRGGALEPPGPAPDFTLTDQDGRPFRLGEQRGSVVVLFFGFTNCPDICPARLAELAAVRRDLGADAEALRVAMITVDPERDTPAALGAYVRRFDRTFLGLTGPQAELDAVQAAYGVFAQRHEHGATAPEYTVDHSGYVYVVDKAGRWRLIFDPEASVDDMTSDLRHLLRTG
ncbi:MAG TPA: SCO family protein [Roseiflexaceae bacterium]|nr:SCO family protein [Roseiflexaceae bacterium]